MRFALIISIIAMSELASADIKSIADVARLPPYCSGTQSIRNITKDPRPINDYIAIYGTPFIHLHHYCWALDRESTSWRVRDKTARDSQLRYALGDIQYVLDRSTPDFMLLPEILNTKARILFSLRRDGEAVAALNQAINTKNDYVEAYIQLSDYYVKRGDKTQAVKLLEQGIENTENANKLIKRLEKLGKSYQGTPGSARAQKETPRMTETKTETTEIVNTPVEPASATAPTPDQVQSPPPNNPYCRFCP